jgi:N-acetylmuramoyl-L-alanine amidase
LNVNVRFLDDQQALVAGGVREDELRQEILAQADQLKNPPAVPTATAVAGATQAAIPTAAPSLEPTPTEETQAQEEPPPAGQIERIRRIVIDAGHGGNDAGAPGYDRRYHEKQATLDIAKRVVGYLKDQPEEPGLEVLMTRTGDYYITLKYRTDFANSHDADLFVSIHCNSNPRSRAHGTEIYQYGSRASNKLAEVAAVRENGETDPYDYTMTSLRTNFYKSRSTFLAQRVEEKIVELLGQHFRNIQKAPFYVLAHADMPSILVETAFISNEEEENKLRDPYWRDKMAKAIAEGIIAYKDRVEGMDENQQASR